jgi:L-2-hydroxyglutarate oxidase LhgO
LPESTIPPRLLQKGSYCVFNGRSPFSHLVYPFRHGLHTSLDMAGRLRFGPDAEWIEEIDYSFDEGRMGKFYAKIREFWPSLEDGKLGAGWTAVRSKIARQPANETEFIVQDCRTHRVPGLINLFGIESPGLTASLALAREVASRL